MRNGKYGVADKADRTGEDGFVYDSKREMLVFGQLCLLQRAGIIRGLERQVRYDLHATGPLGAKTKVCSYVADFRYVDLDGRVTVSDAKGVRTALYKLKRKWMEIEYHIRILEQ